MASTSGHDHDHVRAADDEAPDDHAALGSARPDGVPDDAGGGRSDAEADALADASVPDTLISLIVAFVIAMAFRGFVLEGFVIPTGSMAPTLLGEHVLWRSPATGYVYATDAGQESIDLKRRYDVPDAILGPGSDVQEVDLQELRQRTRPGDRVLVMKWFYNFFDPKRYDVVVFKNPTNSDQNYIKRLVGLPNEAIWLADGDVFTRRAGDTRAPFQIRRKPDYIQQAVWQPVYDSGWAPIGDRPADFRSPWRGNAWSTGRSRVYRCDTAEPTTLWWSNRIRPLIDWNVYNTFRDNDEGLYFHVSDLRIAANIIPDDSGLEASLTLLARNHEFRFDIQEDEATIRMRRVGREKWEKSASATVNVFQPGQPTNIECWHVDQRLVIRVNDEPIVEMSYDWDTYQRLREATGISVARALERSRYTNPWVRSVFPSEPEIRWQFEGSPLEMHRVRVDRDLYYRPTMLDNREPAIATHPEHLAVTGPDQFFMLGDNSAASKDSRLWGEPDELVASQIDDSSFLVNRRLIVGKAWCVYFPSPFAVREGGARFVPDFGRIRFIR